MAVERLAPARPAPAMTLALKHPELLHEGSFVNGQWCHSSRTLPVVNPANGHTLAQISLLDADGARAAIDAAAASFPAWAGRPAAERADLLERW